MMHTFEDAGFDTCRYCGERASHESHNNSPTMLKARQIVEEHISTYGMVPHPDRLKEAISRSLLGDVRGGNS